jgi:SAM-dependent methyltransferase
LKYKNIASIAHCPVCQCIKAQILWTVSSKRAALHFVSPIEDPERYERLRNHLHNLWGKETSDIVKCNFCEFVYSYPYIPGDKLFYDLAFVRSDYPQCKWEFEVALQLVKKTEISSPRILELGAGDGAFIKRLTHSNIEKENIVAFEYSEYGSKNIQKLGVNCFVDDIRNVPQFNLGGKFDYIFMFQALEHMGDICGLLEYLRSLLNTGGQIIFAVPNEKRIEFNELNDALLDMPPNHIGRWNKTAFEIYANRNGFELISHQYENINTIRELVRFMIYRFLKRSQNIKSIDNYVRYKFVGLARKLFLIGIIGLDLVLSISLVLRFIKNANKLGISQLAQLKAK